MAVRSEGDANSGADFEELSIDEETVLDLERFNFVQGPNGSGKSSIQMALEYLFCAYLRKTHQSVANGWKHRFRNAQFLAF
jgi:AAA15 family ATPase/GTPase